MKSEKPVVGITMGDPAGCGPEITIKAFNHKNIYEKCRPIVVGDMRVFEQMVARLESIGVLPKGAISLHRIDKVAEAFFEYGTIDILHLDLIDLSDFAYGKLSAMCGKAAFACVTKVIELAMNGEVDATVTNALNKEAMNMAGYHYAGHTEIYAKYTQTRDYAMMLAHGDLRVVHVSTHVSLREACDRVKKDRVLTCIRLADKECRKLGIPRPRIAVAGLNPHAGEGGLFGREETEEIIPAIEAAKRFGIDAIGPIPPDTVFSKAKGGWYDMVVVMYHDQGHIPLKLEGFVFNRQRQQWDAVQGINVTLGLPIVRVSVDHGTAFDQAGKGTANEDSLINAIEYAAGVQSGV